MCDTVGTLKPWVPQGALSQTFDPSLSQGSSLSGTVHAAAVPMVSNERRSQLSQNKYKAKIRVESFLKTINLITEHKSETIISEPVIESCGAERRKFRSRSPIS